MKTMQRVFRPIEIKAPELLKYASTELRRLARPASVSADRPAMRSATRPRPLEGEAPVRLLEQRGVDRGSEAGIVELTGEVGTLVLRDLLPGGADLGLAREDPIVRSLVAPVP